MKPGTIQKPEIVETIPVKEVLEILRAQLEILKVLAAPMMFISGDSDEDLE